MNIINNVFQGFLIAICVASDAFTVSTANGMSHTKMKKSNIFFISITFAFFQCIMPLLGFFVGRKLFANFQIYIPYISMLILCVLGCKMIFDSFDKNNKNEKQIKTLSSGVIILQAIATSIDALSVGLALTTLETYMALIYSIIIFFVTFILSLIGIYIGKKFGTKFEKIATIFAGIILIVIGLSILIR